MLLRKLVNVSILYKSRLDFKSVVIVLTMSKIVISHSVRFCYEEGPKHIIPHPCPGSIFSLGHSEVNYCMLYLDGHNEGSAQVRLITTGFGGIDRFMMTISVLWLRDICVAFSI